MKLLTFFLIALQSTLIGTWLSSAAAADTQACKNLLRPLHNQVSQVKDRGGMWDKFERKVDLRDHSALALQLDSKVIALLFTLDYLCKTQDGIPYNDVAHYVVNQLKEKGKEKFTKEHLANGHTQKEITKLLEFAKFSESHLNRKLDFEQIKKSVERSKRQIERYTLLYQNKNSPETIAEGKALMEDIAKLRTTDPYFKQADFEHSQTPHIFVLSNRGDTM